MSDSTDTGAGAAETPAGRPEASEALMSSQMTQEGSEGDAPLPAAESQTAGEGHPSGPVPSAPADTPISSWPKYRSHKVVQAARIVGIDDKVDPWMLYVLPDNAAQDAQHEQFLPTEPGMAKRVSVGDYAMLYPDGFRSVSPAKAFDEGYQPADGEDEDDGAALSGSGIHIEEGENGEHTFHAMVDGEQQEPVTVPAGHRLIGQIKELVASMLGEVRGATTAPPEAGEQPAPAIARRSPVGLVTRRGMAASQVAAPPARPGVPPTPTQAALTPPQPPAPVLEDGELPPVVGNLR